MHNVTRRKLIKDYACSFFLFAIAPWLASPLRAPLDSKLQKQKLIIHECVCFLPAETVDRGFDTSMFSWVKSDLLSGLIEQLKFEGHILQESTVYAELIFIWRITFSSEESFLFFREQAIHLDIFDDKLRVEQGFLRILNVYIGPNLASEYSQSLG